MDQSNGNRSGFREKAAATVSMTASAIASDPMGTLKALAGLGAKTAAKTAFTLPLKIGAKAAGPAVSIALRALELGHRRGHLDGGEVPPAPDVAVTPVTPAESRPSRPTVVPSPVPEVRTLTNAPAEAPPRDALIAGADVNRDALPVPDYDHLSLQALRARVARLTVAELARLLDYERANANRPSVLTLLENRIAKIST